jgi:tetrahydromethanopterin S-methyltransferase subunit G
MKPKYSQSEFESLLEEVKLTSEDCERIFQGISFEENRLFVYAWCDSSDRDLKTKFGEHWVNSGKNPWGDTESYVRNDQNKAKHKFDEGIVKLVQIWDVTEYAKARGMDYKGSKVDNEIRSKVGHVYSSEWHSLNPLELILRVNLILSKEDQPLPEVELSTAQYEALLATLTIFGSKKDRIMAELFARFGKTIFSGAVAIETGISLTIVASYVKTVFSSFASQITSFEQFKNIVHVDTQDENYREKITKALSEGKQVFAYLSMCNGSNRQERIDFLYSREVSRLTLVDEADLGSHQPKQAQALIKAIKEGDKVILLTGTNADRAVGSWGNLIQDFISCTYYEALVHKKEAKEALGL